MSEIIEYSNKLAQDAYSGSSEIIKKFLKMVQKTKPSRNELRKTFKILMSAHPDMAVLKGTYRILQNVPEDGISIAAMEFLKSLESAPEKIGEHLAKMLHQNAIVMTYSRSGTVGEALLKVNEINKIGGIVLSESRPDLEGRDFAKFFTRYDIQVTLTLDCALGNLIEGVDAVVIGADAVTTDYIINKTGTVQISLLANYFDKPIYVLASTHKFTMSANPQKIASAKSIWENAPDGIFVQSPLFERIPLALLTAVICERGPVGIEEIKMILE
ncbi:hypothetical protein J7L68_09615 [bacterium]|nr:hypothetical protein [bacterium]